jgi:hypothetical protein
MLATKYEYTRGWMGVTYGAQQEASFHLAGVLGFKI